MVEVKDLVIIEAIKEMQTTARYLAEKRILYEYPRIGYGEYNETHLLNIINGYLGEFCFFEYIHNHLKEKFSNLEPLERYNKIKDRLVYKMIIGHVQPDWDFKINNKTVEVKTYGTKFLAKADDVFSYNLLIDIDQVKNERIPDLYIQCFLVKNQESLFCVLAGYHEGLPKRICEKLNRPAYCVAVKELTPMANLIEVL